MKKSIKKTVVTLMAAAVITSSAVAAPLSKPVTVDASTYSQVRVTCCDAPLRTQPYKTYDEIVRIPSGAVVEVVTSKVNDYGNTWYYVEYEDQNGYWYSGWIYEGNLY